MLLLSLGTTGLVALLQSAERGIAGDLVPLMAEQWTELIADAPAHSDKVPIFPAHFQSAK